MKGIGRIAAVAAVLSLMAGCGGGGGGGGGGSAAVSGPTGTLTLTSQPVVSLYEGSTAAFYTATSVDTAGKTVSYSLSGTDAGQFTLNASTGALAFKTAPSYASPTDASGDNEYLVTITASDGALTATLPLAVEVVQNLPARAYSWSNAPFGGGGFVSGLMYHPTQANLLYARTDVGGAFRWNPATAQWIPLTDFLGRNDSQLTGVVSLALDPNNANKVYLAVGQYIASWAEPAAILRSSDQGATWSRTNLPFDLGGNSDGRETGERLQVDPNNGNILYLGSNQNGLWKSMDGGVTWAQVSSFTPTSLTLVAFDKRATSGGLTTTIYAGVNTTNGASLYRSLDGGSTWSAVPGAPTGLLPHHAKFDSNGTLYVTYSDALGPNGIANGAVYKYNSGTGVWTNITPSAPTSSLTFGYSGLGVDQQNPGVIEVATIDRWSINDDIYRSTNGGVTWTALNASSTHSPGIYAWLTAYNGGSITKMGHWMGALDIDPFNSNNAVYGTGFGLYMTANQTAVDTGATIAWNFNVNGFEETVPTSLISTPSGAHLLTTLGDVAGARYTTLSATDTSGYLNPPSATNSSIDFAQQNPKLIVRTSSGVASGGYLSSDNGVTWTALGSTAQTSGNGSGAIAMSAAGTSMVWVPANQGASYSVNNGATWLASTGFPTTSNGQYTPIADRAVDKIFYGYDASAGKLYQSTDGGATFAVIISGLPTGGGVPLSIPWSQRDLWIPTPSGLVHIAGVSASATTLSSVQQAYAIGYGAPAPGANYPSLYLNGMVGGVVGFYRSDDGGATWVQLNDALHQYGWIGVISGDPRVWGRVYLGTGGRGVIVGNR